jgi:hypothetical protein
VSVTGVFLLLLTAGPGQIREPGLVLPPQHKGAITATLELRVPEQGPAPGRGRVGLTIRVHGPLGLEVDEPQLEDALEAWRTPWAASSWSFTEQAASWEETLELVQTKPGVVPLPGLTLRVRSGPTATWETIAWPDLLNEARDVPGPEQLPPFPPSPWPRVLLALAIALVSAAGLALLVRLGRRWRKASNRPLSAHERALARLAAIPAEPAAAVLHLDALLRGYLEERFGVEAMRKTTREVLAALEDHTALPAERASALAELLAWCDVAKFARGEQGPDIEQATERARGFVRITAPGQGEKEGEGRESGEKQTVAQGR